MAEPGARSGLWLGLVVGAALGAGATWLAMARPWRSARPAAIAAADAAPGPERPDRPRKRRGRSRAGGAETDDVAPPVLTAADHAMTWRGAAIALPTRDVDLGDEKSGGRALEAGEIDEVMQRASGPVLACIQDALAGAELAGEVRLEMLIGGGGEVQKVRVGAPRWLVSHGIADCASAAARRIRFPATGAPTVVNAPYHID